MAGSNSDSRVCNLCVFVNIKFGCRHFFFLKETGNTILPRFETVKSRSVVQCFGGNSHQYAYGNTAYKPQYPQHPEQFLGRYPSDEHHHTYHSEQQHSCRKVFRCDEQEYQSGEDHDIFKGIRIGPIFVLPFGQDE